MLSLWYFVGFIGEASLMDILLLFDGQYWFCYCIPNEPDFSSYISIIKRMFITTEPFNLITSAWFDSDIVVSK